MVQWRVNPFKALGRSPAALDVFANGTGEYDTLNRLTSFARGTLNSTKDGISGSASREQEWSLDALGNWESITTDSVTQTRTHDSQNRITSVSGATTPTYSPNGEMTGDETGQSLVYDAWGRLVSAGSSSYAYDALTRRIEQDGQVLYYSQQWQVLEEREAVSGDTNDQYVWSAVYVDAMVLRDHDTNSDGTLDQRLYVLQDANFNVTALVDDSGTVIERYVYDPYGERTVLDANWAADADGQSDVGWVYGHQGGRLLFDDNVDFRNRVLLVALGRWNRQDPMGYVDGGNLYEASRSTPVTALDPEGTKIIKATAGSWWTTTPVKEMAAIGGQNLLSVWLWAQTGDDCTFWGEPSGDFETTT